MLRKYLIAFAGLFVAAAGAAWWQLGPFNGPSRPPPRDKWEALLRERIKLPEGYSFEVFARDLGRLRLMQMTENGDLIVSGYRDGNILLVKADRDGDGRSDGQEELLNGSNQPHGLLLEGNTLYVAEEQRVVRYDFDGTKLDNERVILDGIPGGDGHSSPPSNEVLMDSSICRSAQAAMPASRSILGGLLSSASRTVPHLSCLPRACAIRWGLTGSRELGRSSAWIMAATTWATTFPMMK